MKPEEAAQLMGTLRAAFPSTDLSEETARLYLATLKSLNYELGRKALASVLETRKFFPPLAAIHEQYRIAREQRAREVREEQRVLENMAYDNLPRPPLKEIPSIREFLQEPNAPDLPEEGAGDCGDCKENRTVYRYGKFRVCASCANRRLRAKAKVA